MGLFPHLPADNDPRDLGAGLPPELYEHWIAAVQKLYPDLEPEEAKAQLQSDAEEILQRVEPYTWGAKPLAEEDPVEWAEQATAQAAKAQASVDTLHRMQEDPVIRESFPKRLGALRRAEERSAVSSTRKALRGLLRAAKALREGLRKQA